MKKLTKGKFIKASKGAVSVFLTIILVPMTMVSGLFVDSSKVELSKGVIESAADLTLNTALTDYDVKLKDLYGIFATAQDTDELYDRLEGYYKSCITSSGVDAGYADLYSKQIMQQLHLTGKDDTGTADMLNMELNDFSVEKDTVATAANPTILKKEIIEFMKYRAPINTGLSILSSLKSFKTLKDQNKLVEDRKEYYEAEKGVMEDLKEAWNHINNYNGRKFISDPNYFTNLKNTYSNDNLNTWEENYKTVSKDIVMNLYKTADYVQFDNRIQPKSDGAVIEPHIGVGIDHDYSIYDDDYYKNDGYLKDKFQWGEYIPNAYGMECFLKSYKSARDNYATIADEVEKYYNDNNSGAHDVQYVAQAIRKKSFNGNWNKFVSYHKAFQNLWEGWLATKYITVTGNVPVYDEIMAMEFEGEGIENYINGAVSEYESYMVVAQKVFNDLNDKSGTIDSEGKADPQDSNDILKPMYDKVNEFDPEELRKGADDLKNAREKIENAKAALEPDGSLTKAKTQWSNDASNGGAKDSSIAQQDREEIQDLGKYLNADDMQKMITRLQNIETNLRTTADELDKYKYYGSPLTKVEDVDDAISAMHKGGISDQDFLGVPINASSLESQANTWFDEKPGFTRGNLNVNWITNDASNPKLHGSGTNKLKLYSYLYNKFNDVSAAPSSDVPSTTKKTEDKSNGEDTYNDTKSKSADDSKEKADEAKEGNNTSEGTEDLSEIDGPSKAWSGGGKDPVGGSSDINTGDDALKGDSSNNAAMNNLGSVDTDDVSNLGIQLRDKLYILSYAMNMFSYDTIVAECKDKNQGITDDEVKEKIKTLTGTPIDKDHNRAYGAEVEYFIYGQSNGASVALAYASIFGIRFGFNVVYAFTDSSIRESAFAIATPISAATMGIIPVPLIQAAIIIGLACAESAFDLIDLKDGKAVPLYKSQDTWRCSVTGLVNFAKSKATEIANKVVDEAIDKGVETVSAFLDDKSDEIDGGIDAVKNGINNQAESVYKKTIEDNANRAVQYLTTTTNEILQEVSVDKGIDYLKENVVKEQIKGKLETWKNNITDDGSLEAKAKIFAADAIINGNYIDGFVDVMADSIKESNPASQLEATLKEDASSAVAQASGAIMDKVNEIKQGIMTKLSAATDGIGSEIKSMKNEMIQSVKTSLSNGADSLKGTLHENINKIGGSSTTKSSKVSLKKGNGTSTSKPDAKDSTGLASFFAFRYSDYLKLFLLIGLFSGEEGVLLRIGDAIQGNMMKENNDENYKLSNSSVYVKLDATVLVKPVVLAMPLFADVQNNPKTNTNWYTIEYSDIRGY